MIVKTTLFLLSTSLFNVMAVMANTFTPPDLVQLARPSVPVTSPSGALAVYAQSVYNIEESKVTFSSFTHTREVSINGSFFL